MYGKPLYQCIRAYKMRVAARLLGETDRTVLDIAGEFGYGNSSKFAAAFREVLGASPGEYRQKKSQHFGAKIPQIGAETRRRIKYNQVRQQGRGRTPSPWVAERALTPGVFLFAS